MRGERRQWVYLAGRREGRGSEGRMQGDEEEKEGEGNGREGK